MNITVEQSALLPVLAHTLDIASEKSPLPSASRVLLTADGSSVRVEAVAEKLRVIGTVPAQLTARGAISVEARDLYDRVKAFPPAAITLAPSNDTALSMRLTAKGSKLRFLVHTADTDNFPRAVDPKDADWIDIDGKVLERLIDSVKFSIAVDDTRQHLAGMLLESNGKRLLSATTDGHRLSVEETAAETKPFSVLIPRDGVAKLRKLCDAKTVGLFVQGPEAFFRTSEIVFACRLSDAQFPPYQQVIPYEQPDPATVNRQAMIRSLRAAALSAKKGADNEKRTVWAGLRLEFSGGAARVSASSADGGEAHDEIPIDYSGKRRLVGISGAYLVDWLNARDDETVTISMNGELDPVVLKAGGALGVVMPARL